MNKTALAAITCLVIITVGGFCGGRQEGATDLTPLKVMILQTSVPKSEGRVDDNQWTRLIQDEAASKLGLNVKFVPIGTSQVNHTIMMATGSAPDLAFTHGRLLFMKFATDGGLHDLGPFLSEGGPNIVKTLGEGILKLGRIDGTQYGIPSRKADQARYTSFIRKDWLDELGLDPPTNRDELEAVLRAFRDMDPARVGVTRIIPWGSFADDPGTVFDSDFAFFDIMYSFLEDDEALNMQMVWPERDGFRDFLAWVHRMYQEGLVDPEFATDDSTIKDRKIVNGEVGFFHAYYRHPFAQNSSSIMHNLSKNHPGSDLLPIDVFMNSVGEYRKLRYLPTRYYVFCPEKSKRPAEVISYLNWLLEDDVAWTLAFGREGDQYRMQDGMPVIDDPAYFRQSFDYIRGRLRVLGDFTFSDDIMKSFEEQLRIYDFNGRDDLAKSIALEGSFYEPVFSERMQDMTKYGPGLIKICEKYWVKIITEDDFEANYADLMEKLESRNIEAISAERSEYYRRHQ